MARTHKQERMRRWERKAIDITGSTMRFLNASIIEALEAAYQEGLKDGAKTEPAPKLASAVGGFVDGSGKVDKSGRVG